jgi:hypothetical protein
MNQIVFYMRLILRTLLDLRSFLTLALLVPEVLYFSVNNQLVRINVWDEEYDYIVIVEVLEVRSYCRQTNRRSDKNRAKKCLKLFNQYLNLINYHMFN